SGGVGYCGRGQRFHRPSIHVRGDTMRNSLTALATAATIAVATVSAPTAADARWGWRGGAFVGGLAARALIGSAFASPYYSPDYGGYYGAYFTSYSSPAPVYYDYSAPAPAYYNYYAVQPYYTCWRWRYGYRYRVC